MMSVNRWKPYPETKDSGIEWLGQIPAHWEARRLKDVGALIGGSGFPHEHQGIQGEDLPFYKVGDLVGSSDGMTMHEGRNSVSRETAAQLRASVIPGGSLLWAKIGAALFLNRRRITAQPCCIDNNMTAFVPDHDKASTDWAFFWTGTLDFGELANPGAVPSLSEGYQSALPFILPPPDEQQAIADFLDRETAKIDALVEKKERLIELLQEKRTALITHAVTQGLDPNAPMKDSGIEWLGQIPAHWRETRLGWVVEVSGGHTPDTGDLRFWEGEIPWVTPKDMKRRVIVDSIDHVSEAALQETGLRLLGPGNVLIVVRGMILAHTFPVAVPRVPATINQDMKALLPIAGLEFDYLAYLLEGISEFILSLVEESAHGTKRLQTELWKRVGLFLPPSCEQMEITAHLDRETAKIDALIAKVQEAIERLKEYRTALISAAVTGKIDVREEVVH